MIKTVKAKVGNDTKPEEHLALVIEDISDLSDLAVYRKALMGVAKSVLITDDLVPYQCDNLFWILQLADYIASSFEQKCIEADYIASSFEQQCVKKGGEV